MNGYRPELLFDRLRALDLPGGTYAVFGSGPLAARGLIDRVGDLDVLVLGAAWALVKPLGSIVMHGQTATVDLGNGLTFGRSWAYGNFDVAQLIAEADVIEGIAFVRLAHVVEYKAIARRPKDLEHIRLATTFGV